MPTYTKPLPLPPGVTLAGYADPRAVATDTGDIYFSASCNVPRGVRVKVFLLKKGATESVEVPLEVEGFRGGISADGTYARVTVFNFEKDRLETQVLDNVTVRPA
jgi:hypothetical protein